MSHNSCGRIRLTHGHKPYGVLLNTAADYNEKMCEQIAGLLHKLYLILPSGCCPPRCWYCGNALAKYRHLNVFCTPLRYPFLQTRDHITPISRGGSKSVSNRVFACLRCNRYKANRTLEEYRALLGQTSPFYGESVPMARTEMARSYDAIGLEHHVSESRSRINNHADRTKQTTCRGRRRLFSLELLVTFLRTWQGKSANSGT